MPQPKLNKETLYKAMWPGVVMWAPKVQAQHVTPRGKQLAHQGQLDLIKEFGLETEGGIGNLYVEEIADIAYICLHHKNAQIQQAAADLLNDLQMAHFPDSVAERASALLLKNQADIDAAKVDPMLAKNSVKIVKNLMALDALLKWFCDDLVKDLNVSDLNVTTLGNAKAHARSTQGKIHAVLNQPNLKAHVAKMK